MSGSAAVSMRCARTQAAAAAPFGHTAGGPWTLGLTPIPSGSSWLLAVCWRLAVSYCRNRPAPFVAAVGARNETGPDGRMERETHDRHDFRRGFREGPSVSLRRRGTLPARPADLARAGAPHRGSWLFDGADAGLPAVAAVPYSRAGRRGDGCRRAGGHLGLCG